MMRTALSRANGGHGSKAALGLAMLCLVGCGSGGGGGQTMDAGSNEAGPNEGLSVGSPCTSNAQCDSPTAPECLDELKPLSSLAGVPAELADLGLEFESGYCSSVLSCADDTGCGELGKCYRPFREVAEPTLRELEPPLGVSAGTLDFLPNYGVCLRACAAASECEVGQICELPLDDLVSLVPGAINDQKFCIPDPDCAGGGCTAGPCSPNPCQNAGTCSVSGSSFTCECPDGYAGDTCETQTVSPDRVIGQACTSDAQCDIRGTPRCLTEIYPLDRVLPFNPEDALSQIGLEFPRGYCTNEPNCASNIECGPGGKCLAPFRNVTTNTFRELELTFTPPLAPGALDYVGGYGVCLRQCVDNYECFSDQSCQIVLDDLISLVPGSVNAQTFCVPHPDCRFCNTNASCIAVDDDTASCVCNPGFTGNGLTCAATGAGACASNPCQNGGACTDGSDGGYTCACEPAYAGTNCQIGVACAPNPCENGGTCSPTSATSFMCACPSGFSGPTCSQMTMCPFLAQPANGNRTVLSYSVGGLAQFECSNGFALSNPSLAVLTCQTSGQWNGPAPTCVPTSNPCSSVPCQNGGVCTPGTGSAYTCSCDGTGYTGATCTSPRDCGTLGTLSNGTITTTPASTTTFGATAMYACNGGYTLTGAATRTCGTSGTWSGTAPTCSMQTANPCMPNPCLNGGSCTATGASTYMCGCVNGYSGMNCQTAFDCGTPAAPANGTVTAPSTTVGGVATYACGQGYSLNGSATQTCSATGWSGTAPTCVAASCGTFTDVIYRLTATFSIRGTPLSAGNQTFTGLTNNATTAPFQSNTNTTPFTGSSSGGTFTRGFARLRFTNNAAGVPIAGSVRLIEWYVPLEFMQTNGAPLAANNDHSVGILNMPGSLSNCGGGNTACTNHTPTVNRACTANAQGTLSGTTLSWGACSPAWTGQNSWSYASSARSAAGVGCATNYVQYGNNASSSGLIPESGKGDAYQVYNQQLANITFSGTNYATATWAMAEIQIPNGTGKSNTWLTITNATPVGTDCGSTVGTDLVCNVQ